MHVEDFLGKRFYFGEGVHGKVSANEIDGELANFSFDPSDPASIEAALQQVSDAIDDKTKSYGRNDWVQNLAAQVKDQGRNAILEKTAAARVGK
jgi:hypothetical protein